MKSEDLHFEVGEIWQGDIVALVNVMLMLSAKWLNNLLNCRKPQFISELRHKHDLEIGVLELDYFYLLARKKVIKI